MPRALEPRPQPSNELKEEDPINPTKEDMHKPTHFNRPLVENAIAHESRRKENTEQERKQRPSDQDHRGRDKHKPEPKRNTDKRNVVFHTRLLRPTTKN